MIIETYMENLPYVRGFKVSVGKFDPGSNMHINLKETDIVLKAIAFKSLEEPVFISADRKNYSARHILAKKLQKVRNKILEGRQKCN